jgi:hypothetical protein
LGVGKHTFEFIVNYCSGILGSCKDVHSQKLITLSDVVTLHIISNGEVIGSEDWLIETKSTELKPRVDESGNTYADFTGTVTNLGSTNPDKVQIHITVLNDGVIPARPDSLGDDVMMEVYPTKAIFSLDSFSSGETMGWTVRAKIRDLDIETIDYEVGVYVKNEIGDFKRVHKQKKTLLVEK